MRSSAILLAAAVLVAACGADDDSSGGDATSGGSEAPLMSIVPTDDLGAPSEPVELPASFPGDVPIPADVELQNAEEHVGESTTIFEITGWFDGDPIRVARDYEQVLQDLGYEITSRTESPDNLYFVAENTDWYVSAGFFPDPIRNVGASVGVTVAPAG
ncbi:MAG TPA: hypothetical protein VK917_09530 [Ilumatobacter sp.]|nr:hypothetical protein [Ilumatobacter sp.]